MLHLNLAQQKIGKIFLEIRHKEIFTLPEKKFKILEKFTKKYPDYNIDSPERIILINPEKQIQIHISINRILIDWDSPTSVDEFIKICNSVLGDLKNIITIEKVSRIGLRTFFQYKEGNQKDIENYIFNRYFSSGAKPTEMIADEIFAPRVHFSGRKGKLTFNFAVSYQQEQLIHANLKGPVDSQTNNYFLADVDVYREGSLNIGTVTQFLDEYHDFIKTNVPNYLKKVEG